MKKHNFIYILIATIVLMLCCTFSVAKAQENEGLELGNFYYLDKTIFKINSSNASKVTVVVENTENGTKELVQEGNTWIGYVAGDLNGKEYSFKIEYENGDVYENVLDPYGKFVNNSGTRNVIVDDTVTSFLSWENQLLPLEVKDQNKIIYGVNVKNFTSHSSWKGTDENRGKLLGLIEKDTKYNNLLTGFDYVKNLGITYIELPYIYNSNNPFSINPIYISGAELYSGNLEFKQVVNSYYLNNIGVILAFDYKCLSANFINELKKVDSNAYLDSNNNLDLNKNMTQKYIEDLILYYAKTYKLSGIKIEHMSDYSVSFINQLSDKLIAVNEHMLIYGDGRYTTSSDDKASENNLDKLTNTKMLNGSLNYALFGNLTNKDEKGILEANYSNNTIESLKFALLSSVDNGQIDYSAVEGVDYKAHWGNDSSYSLVNYVGNKNGLSIYDKLIINNLTGENLLKQKVVLAMATQMMSGGIPYINSGDDLLNSYIDLTNDSNSICTENNAFCFYSREEYKIIDWTSVVKNETNIEALKALINYRKSGNSVAQTNANVIKNNVSIFVNEKYPGVIGFIRKYPNAYTDEVEKVVAIFNYSNNDYNIEGIKGKGWHGLYTYNSAKREGNTIQLKAISLYTEFKEKQPKVNSWVTLIFVMALIGGMYYLNVILNKKLVEKKGYDIKDISKKYRPFIKNNKTISENDEQPTNEEENFEEQNDEKENGDS